MTRILLLGTIVGLACFACGAADSQPAGKGGTAAAGPNAGGSSGAPLTSPLAAAAARAANMSPEEKEVRAAVDNYIADFNRGDAKAVASLFADDAEHVDSEGEVLRGRKGIEERAAKFLAEHKGAKLDLKIHSLDVLHSGLAIERGTAAVVAPMMPPSPIDYVAIYSKHDGKWQIDSIQNFAAQPAMPSRDERLSELDWLIGDWIGQERDATVHTTFAWTANKAFITASFSVVAGDKVEIAGTQVIGWDPARQEVRSWVFDSTGAFGEGVWSNDENRWTVTSAGTTEDGRKATAVSTYTKTDDGYEWQSVSREVDDEMLPDIEPIKMIRVGGAAVPTENLEKKSPPSEK